MLWIADSSKNVRRASHHRCLTKAYARVFSVDLIKGNKSKEAAKMGRQRNGPQMKEQENSSEELYEMEANTLSHREFRVMTIRLLNTIKKDIETIKKDNSEIRNTISEINNTLEGINSRLDEADDRSSVLQDR